MQIKLKIDDKEKTFISRPVFMVTMRRVLELQKDGLNFNLLNTPEEVDQVAALIVDIFGGQFTVDQLMNGLNMKRWSKTLGDFLDEVLGMLPEADDASAKK